MFDIIIEHILHDYVSSSFEQTPSFNKYTKLTKALK